MFKMSSHYSFGHLKHKLWPKEGPEIKWSVWLPTIKSWKSTQFLCVKMACNILLKRSWWGLQLCFRPHLNQRAARKVMAPQSRESPNLGDFKTPTWESRDKKPFRWAPWRGAKYTIRGKVVASPQVRAVVSLVCPCCSWLLAPKVLQLCTNHLMWVVCRPVWVSEAYQLFLVPSQSSSTPFYPSKCCELGSVLRLLTLPMFSV
jgi:hypothetical protein